MSEKHLDRYLDELSFRWDHRIPHVKKTKSGKRKTYWRPWPVADSLIVMLKNARGRQIRRSFRGGLFEPKRSHKMTYCYQIN